MSNLTPEGFAKCLIILRAAYGSSFNLYSKEEAAVWFELLNDLPEQAVVDAVKHLVKTHKAFPAISDIRQICESVDSLSWSEAWKEICDKAYLLSSPVFSLSNPVSKVIWSSPVVELAFHEFGGTNAVLAIESKDLAMHRAQFRQIYEIASRRSKIRVLPSLSAQTLSTQQDLTSIASIVEGREAK